MRLIDADVLITWFNDHYDDEEFSVGYISGLIKDAPTIEPQRMRGRWVIVDENVCCSECGSPNMEYNFCPNCGADMRGDEK